MIDKTATIRRNDGVIQYVIGPSTLINTFFAIVMAHDAWLCSFVNDLAHMVTPEMTERVLSKKVSLMVESIKQGLYESMESHKIGEDYPYRIERNTDEDMYFGSIHPTELALLGEKIQMTIEIAHEFMTIKEDGEKQFDSIKCWPEAAKKLVRPAENIAVVFGEDVQA